MTDLKLTPEEQFIFACLRMEFSGSGDADFPVFAYASFDWNRVYNKSLQWRIAPLLYKIIEKRLKSPLKTCPRENGEGDTGGCSPLQNNTPNIPKHFLGKIKVEYLITCVANNAIYKDLAEISGVFSKAGIKFILLKGSHLAQFVYQDAGVRPMGDIDIMVKKDDLQKAEELLLQMGYTHPIDTKSSLHLPYFSHPEKIRSLEVHWTITKPIWQFNIDIEGLWERAKTVRKNSKDMLVFSPEDLLLYLSLHATYHHNLRDLGLIPCCDIATTIDHYARNIDWDQLKQRALNWEIAKHLYLSLRLSHEILRVGVPDRISQAFNSDPLNEQIVSDAKKRILSIKAEKSTFADVPHLFHDDFHPNNSFIKRVFFIFKKIFIHPNELASYYALPITSLRVYFYYITRIVLLLYRFIVKFSLYQLTHGKKHVSQANLDLWLISKDLKDDKRYTNVK